MWITWTSELFLMLSCFKDLAQVDTLGCLRAACPWHRSSAAGGNWHSAGCRAIGTRCFVSDCSCKKRWSHMITCYLRGFGRFGRRWWLIDPSSDGVVLNAALGRSCCVLCATKNATHILALNIEKCCTHLNTRNFRGFAEFWFYIAAHPMQTQIQRDLIFHLIRYLTWGRWQTRSWADRTCLFYEGTHVNSGCSLDDFGGHWSAPKNDTCVLPTSPQWKNPGYWSTINNKQIKQLMGDDWDPFADPADGSAEVQQLLSFLNLG